MAPPRSGGRWARRRARSTGRGGSVGLSGRDGAALAFFAAAWFAYHVVVEKTPAGRRSLNMVMDAHRRVWMQNMLARDNRIMDANINASLQNGTAFFASTSLIAIGGALALLRSTEDALSLFAGMPFGLATTREAWEIKVLGLAVIFVYAFYKFAWSYRLFNYAAILLGAVPPLGQGGQPEMEAAAERAGRMNVVAGRHFNRGQRAFFFALAYLGWFVSAYVVLVWTAACLLVMGRRQLGSDALAALAGPDG